MNPIFSIGTTAPVRVSVLEPSVALTVGVALLRRRCRLMALAPSLESTSRGRNVEAQPDPLTSWLSWPPSVFFEPQRYGRGLRETSCASVSLAVPVRAWPWLVLRAKGWTVQCFHSKWRQVALVGFQSAQRWWRLAGVVRRWVCST